MLTIQNAQENFQKDPPLKALPIGCCIQERLGGEARDLMQPNSKWLFSLSSHENRQI